MAKGDLVLLTGATGFLGYNTLLDLLRSGYHVRAAVRSDAKAAKVRAAPSLKALMPSSAQLSFVLVPDMTAPGAYDEAAQGVKYIIHCANPIPSFGEGEAPSADQLEAVFVKPAAGGVTSMLNAAAKSSTVKRVVITSSTVANVPFEYYIDKATDTATRVFTPDDRIPVAPAPYGFEFEAYSAGKAAALNTIDKFVADHKDLGFDVVSILPSWIFGKDELVSSAAGMRVGSTNAVLLGVLLGTTNDLSYSGNAVKGSDVAMAHVRALQAPAVRGQGHQAFVVNTTIVWEDAITIAKKYHPEAFADGRLKDTGKQPTTALAWDVSKSEKVLGIKFSPFEEMVKEVVDQYLELLARE
ncbi:reductase [Echria macrotheca]|uniref:Reductase n=1 Tax=Echria macrotheca TaxID=438768 RepID=A0AAJ0B8K4_9PEZI|nr:reductase [Echria macrotheca]